MNNSTRSALVSAVDSHNLQLVKRADAASRRARKLYQQGGERAVQRSLGEDGLAALDRARYGAERAKAPRSSTANAAFAPQRAAPPSRAPAAPSAEPTRVQRYKQLMAERAQWAKTDQRAVNAANYGVATPEQQRIASRVLRDRAAAQAQADAAKAAKNPKVTPAPAAQPAPVQAGAANAAKKPKTWEALKDRFGKLLTPKKAPAAPATPATPSAPAAEGRALLKRLLTSKNVAMAGGAALLGGAAGYAASRPTQDKLASASVRALRRLADEVLPTT